MVARLRFFQALLKALDSGLTLLRVPGCDRAIEDQPPHLAGVSRRARSHGHLGITAQLFVEADYSLVQVRFFESDSNVMVSQVGADLDRRWI